MREERGKVEFSLKFMKNMYSSGRDFLFFSMILLSEENEIL